MKNRALFAAAFVMALLAGCKTPKSVNGQEGGATIVGAWEAKEIVVAKDWGSKVEQLLPIPTRADRKPVVTMFEAKGTFTEQTWAANDSLLQSKSGFWHQHEDSLFLSYAEEGAKRNAYGMELSARELKLDMLVDFDMDGNRDDKVQVIMKRQ